MSKPWGGIGSWAAEAEREEAEERQTAAAAAAAANPKSFPSLKEAVTAKQPKKKKMTLSEFVSSGSKPPGSTRLTPEEMLRLPTAPKPRADDDVSGPRLGGGFSGYGDDRRNSNQRRGGGFDDDRRQKRGDFDSMMPPPPSRADEVDNWASMKKPISAVDTTRGGGGGVRYGGLGGGSRADEVDNWSFGKKAQPPPQPMSGFGGGGGGGGRLSTFGSGYRDSGSDWRKGGGGERELGRSRLVLDPPTAKNGENVNVEKPEIDTITTTTTKANPFGAARPREEVLAEKGLDWKKLDLEIEAKKVAGGSVSGGSRPSSSQGSRPTSSQSNRGSETAEVKTRPKVNPFGEAKPRELLLEQKGLDWRKIDLDLEHRRVDRPETEEEKALKDEIENLKKELKESGSNIPQESEGEQTSLSDLIKSKEKDLEDLTRELDDKVRFGQKAVERPGSRHGSRPSSGAGRFTSFPERPPSQSGSYDNGRGPEVMDRPRSRGTGDVWTRPGEERRGGFQGGRDRGGFLGNRDFDRSMSRQRW